MCSPTAWMSYQWLGACLSEVNWRQQFHSDPVVAKARKEIADMYRSVRKDNPAMARLLHRRVTQASNAYYEEIFKGSPSEGVGGLTALIEEDKWHLN